jgi:branched-chain amino acid transport system ATP-binding protein
MGLTPPRSGTIKLDGEKISGLRVFSIAQCGVGFVPAERRIFPDLTVRENLNIGKKKGDSDSRRMEDLIYSLFPRLKDLGNHLGGKLSGGEQQMLAISRTLMGNPKLLLLDEPSQGLSPLLVRNIGESFVALKKTGIGILLCEQNSRFAMDIGERGYVLEKGEIRLLGLTEELERNELFKSLMAV